MYFQAINEKIQAKNKDKSLMYDLIINELMPNHYNKDSTYTCQQDHELDLFSHWIYMAILSMANLNNFDFTPQNIQQKLSEKLPLPLVKEAFSKLIYFGFLIQNQDGSISRKYKSHSTQTDITNKSAHTYYALVCDLAKQAINVGLEKREFQCFSMALDQKHIPLAKEIIRKARRQIVALAEEGHKDSVYQVNLMMFPLTSD